MDELLALAAVGGFFMLKRPAFLAELEKSGAATRLGVANLIPRALWPRAKGLYVVKKRLQAKGHVISSAYRAEAVTDAIYADLGRDKPYKGGGAHGRCAALDSAGEPGQDTEATRAAIIASARADSVIGPAIQLAYDEGDHIHFAFFSSDLVDIGRAHFKAPTANV